MAIARKKSYLLFISSNPFWVDCKNEWVWACIAQMQNYVSIFKPFDTSIPFKDFYLSQSANLR